METATIRFGPWGSPTSHVAGLDVRNRLLPWQIRGLSYTATGYGARIPTMKQVFFEGRWRRVYRTIYSNAGTCWVVVNGEKCVVDIY